METINVTTTRKSPLGLSDICLKDGDLITLSALAEAISENPKLGVISLKWIKSYMRDNSREVREVIDSMISEWESGKQ